MDNTQNKIHYQNMYNEEDEYPYNAEYDSEADYLEDNTEGDYIDDSDEYDYDYDYESDDYENADGESEDYDEEEYDYDNHDSEIDYSDWIEPNSEYEDEFDNLDEIVEDIDFSQFSAGKFSTTFSNAKKTIKKSKKVNTIPLGNRVLLKQSNSKISNIQVPKNRKVIIEGKERFKPLNQQPKPRTNQPIKNTQKTTDKRSVRPTTTIPLGSRVGINSKDFKIQNIKVPKDRKVIIEGNKRIAPIQKQKFQKPIQKKPTQQRPIHKTEIRTKKVPVPVTRKITPYKKPISVQKPSVRPSVKPQVKAIPVERRAQIDRSQKKIARILIPSDRKVIVEGVNKFILSNNPADNTVKNIGYYKGKKLKKMVLIFNNITPNNFTIELFNPSAPLDYLYNTSQNLNNKIEVAGGQVSYSDVVYNLLANPTWVHNCKFSFSGTNATAQKAIPLKVIDREITGEQYIQPLNINLNIDNMQVQSDVVVFDITQLLSRPFIPDGMDVIQYTVLPNTSVVMAFYYEQVTQKDLYYEKSDVNKEQF